MFSSCLHGVIYLRASRAGGDWYEKAYGCVKCRSGGWVRSSQAEDGSEVDEREDRGL